MFVEQTANIVAASELLDEMMANSRDAKAQARKIKKMERKGDEIVHHIIAELNSVFVTPIDREDIVQLAGLLDDVVDYMEEIAYKLVLYEVKPTPEMKKLSKLLLSATVEIHEITTMLTNNSSENEIMEKCMRINTIENEADKLGRRAMAKLFRCNEPIYIIKVKELYDYFEDTLDACEDVANVVENILVKHK
jgi:hypothetical protein